MTEVYPGCVAATVEAAGLRVAADYRYDVAVEDAGYAATVYMSPGLVGEAVTGLLLRDGVAALGDVAEVVSVEPVGRLGFRVTARLARLRGPRPRPPRGPVEWGAVETAYRDLLRLVPKSRCPFALHTIAVYAARGGEAERLFTVSDSSRHAAALKTAGLLSGLASRSGLPREGGLVAVSTGRLSGDAVRALAAAGVRVLVANHRPLLSGLLEAREAGAALVLRRRDGRGLAVYTGHGLVHGAPVYVSAGEEGAARGAYGGVTPLC